MRVLVCGSRKFGDREWDTLKMITVLSALNAGHTTDKIHLIHGNARGADSIAGRIGANFGWAISVYPAKWDMHGRTAGLIRNQRMLVEGKPNLVIAFWDKQSRGTKHMIEIAQKAGVPVTIVT